MAEESEAQSKLYRVGTRIVFIVGTLIGYVLRAAPTILQYLIAATLIDLALLIMMALLNQAGIILHGHAAWGLIIAATVRWVGMLWRGESIPFFRNKVTRDLYE